MATPAAALALRAPSATGATRPAALRAVGVPRAAVALRARRAELRVAVALYMGNQVVPLPGVSDQESYHNLALRLLGGHGFSFGENWWPVTQADAPTAHWSFLYTLYVTAVYAIFGPVPVVARLIQAVAVGLLMPWLVFRLAQKLFA